MENNNGVLKGKGAFIQKGTDNCLCIYRSESSVGGFIHSSSSTSQGLAHTDIMMK